MGRKKIGRPPELFEQDPLARGMWDPQASDEPHRWWESTKHQLYFVNALRNMLDLEPLQGERCHHCAQMKSGGLCSQHRERARQSA